MDFITALNTIVEHIPDIENVEEEINVLKNVKESTENESYKEKYEDLRKKYIERFKIKAEDNEKNDKTDTKETEIKIDDIIE